LQINLDNHRTQLFLLDCEHKMQGIEPRIKHCSASGLWTMRFCKEASIRVPPKAVSYLLIPRVFILHSMRSVLP